MSYFGASQRMVGDPGFFDTLKRIGGTAVRGAAGFLTGGPVGAAAAVLPNVTGSRANRLGVALPTFIPPRQQNISPGTAARAGAFVGGAAMGAINTRQAMPTNSTGCPKGMQPAKVYVPGAGYQRIGHCVKIRRRNPYNRAAATRAASRLNSLGSNLKTVRKSVAKAHRELK